MGQREKEMRGKMSVRETLTQYKYIAAICFFFMALGLIWANLAKSVGYVSEQGSDLVQLGGQARRGVDDLGHQVGDPCHPTQACMLHLDQCYIYMKLMLYRFEEKAGK